MHIEGIIESVGEEVAAVHGENWDEYPAGSNDPMELFEAKLKEQGIEMYVLDNMSAALAVLNRINELENFEFFLEDDFIAYIRRMDL